VRFVLEVLSDRQSVETERSGFHYNEFDARVAKSADATDLKSVFPQGECGFNSRPGHQFNCNIFNYLVSYRKVRG
jgi:hypothetical protein